MLKDTGLYRTLRRLIKDPGRLEQRFTDIYKRNGFGGRESVSGPGSDLSQTAALREALPGLLREFNVRTVLDAPCGDYFWMKEARLDLDHYIGADIVADIIEKDRRVHASAGREFRVLDITRDALPAVDLIICRDCLVHLPFAAIFSAIRNFKRSGSRYLLATTFISRTENPNIPAGFWRPLNLQRTPLNFPTPERIIDEHCTEDGGQYPDKSMALWKIETLPSA